MPNHLVVPNTLKRNGVISSVVGATDNNGDTGGGAGGTVVCDVIDVKLSALCLAANIAIKFLRQPDADATAAAVALAATTNKVDTPQKHFKCPVAAVNDEFRSPSKQTSTAATHNDDVDNENDNTNALNSVVLPKAQRGKRTLGMNLRVPSPRKPNSNAGVTTVVHSKPSGSVTAESLIEEQPLAKRNKTEEGENKSEVLAAAVAAAANDERNDGKKSNLEENRLTPIDSVQVQLKPTTATTTTTAAATNTTTTITTTTIAKTTSTKSRESKTHHLSQSKAKCGNQSSLLALDPNVLHSQHAKSSNPDVASDDDFEPEQRCPHCEKSFSTLASLNHHIKKHNIRT